MWDLMFGISTTLHKSRCDTMNVASLYDVSMNMELPVVGVSNYFIRGVILYLTAQNLHGSKIYRKIIETWHYEYLPLVVACSC